MARHPGLGIALIGLLVAAGAFWFDSTLSREAREEAKLSIAIVIGCAWIVIAFGVLWTMLGASDASSDHLRSPQVRDAAPSAAEEEARRKRRYAWYLGTEIVLGIAFLVGLYYVLR